MSIPRNHHYVSQVLSKKFFYNKKAYVYNKLKNKIYESSSTKKLFSRKDLNTIIDNNGLIDHKTVEDEINKFFENDFNKHHKIIVDALNKETKIGDIVSNSEEFYLAIKYLIGMAIIGPFRNPNKMQETNQNISNMLQDISKMCIKELQDNINNELKKVDSINNKFPINFTTLKEEVLKMMGSINFGIMKAPENNFFILPDCNSAIKRFPAFNNNSMLIKLILMPISSKYILTAASRSILFDKFKEQSSGVYLLDEKTVQNYNEILYENAYKEVVCENKVYLEDFLKLIEVKNIFNCKNIKK